MEPQACNPAEPARTTSEGNEKDIRDLDLEFFEFSTIDRIERIAHYILDKEGKKAVDSYMSGPDLREHAKSEFPKSTQSIADNTFSQYLSNIAAAPQSKLFSAGKRRGYYWLEGTSIVDVVEANELASEKTQLAATSKKIEREKLIYPVIESWLIGANQQAADISTFKKNGRWGNPDVLGLKIFDTFDGNAIELTTVEVKTSEANWEQFIFEAISHRRFANRSFFAFLHPDSLVSKIDKVNLQYYCELFRIGVLVVVVEDDIFKKILFDPNPSPLITDEVDVVEFIPAPHNVVPLEKQYEFLQNIGVTGKKKLMQFGLAKA